MLIPFEKEVFFPYLEELEAFPLTIFPVINHAATPLHAHGSHWELVIVTGGSGQHLVGEDAFTIEAADVFLVPSSMEHGYARCRNLDLVNIIFDPRCVGLSQHELHFLPGYSALFKLEPRMRRGHAFRGHLRLDESTVSGLLQTLQRIHEEVVQKRAGFETVAKALFSTVVVDLSRHYAAMTSPIARDLVRLSSLTDWLESHFAEPLQVDSLAARVGMSRSTLERNFRKCFGASPMNYVLALRVQKAEALLKQSALPIAEIAACVGIDDPSYFARTFQKHTGHTPRAYRGRFAA